MRIVEPPPRGADDPRVAAFTRLTDMDLRLALESESGLFMAEGLLVIERCVALGLCIEGVLTSAK